MLTIGLEGSLDFAEKLASILVPGDCVALKGDLGAGKTTIVQQMIRTLHGGDIGIISPTFNLLQTYDVEWLGAAQTVWHYDLYRLEEPEELAELGLEEAFDRGITFIEWPEIAIHWLPDNSFHLSIEFTEDNENRDILIETTTINQARLKQVELWQEPQ